MPSKYPHVKQVGRKNLIFVFWTLLACVCAGQSDPFLSVRPSPVSSTGVSANAVFLSQYEITIPYKVKNPQTRCPINLYISSNRGQLWTLYRTAIPANDYARGGVQQYVVTVPKDGEYWFIIRSSKSENRENPPLGNKPDVAIVVDSVRPQFQVLYERLTNAVSIKWSLGDIAPNPDSLQFSYRFRSNEQWQQASLPARSWTRNATGINGVYTVRVPAGLTQMELRGYAADRAGNRTAMTWNLNLNIAPGNGTGVQALNGVDNALPPGSIETANIRNNRLNHSAAYPPSTYNDPLNPYDTGRPTEFFTVFQNDQNLKTDIAEGTTTTAVDSTSTSAGTEYSTVPQNRRDPAWFPYQPGNSAARSSSSQNVPYSAYKMGIPEDRPTLNQIKLTNTETCELNYEIHEIGFSGVGSVELWYTKDEGKKWEILAKDTDCITPIQITLPGEGIYGVKMVIRNGSGIGDKDPQAGELPQAWIVLDKTAPEGLVKQVGISTDGTSMKIQWESRDKYPAQLPVTLYWLRDEKDESPNPIADQLSTVGEFTWNMPKDIPAKVIIKMEVIDKVGNVGSTLTPLVATDNSRPQGFILNVTPKEEK